MMVTYNKTKYLINLLLTPQDRHSRKRLKQYCRSSKPNINSITFWPDGVSMTLAFSISFLILTAASRSKSTSCRFIWMFSMLEKNLRLRTNKPASAKKKFTCWRHTSIQKRNTGKNESERNAMKCNKNEMIKNTKRFPFGLKCKIDNSNNNNTIVEIKNNDKKTFEKI